VSEIHPSAFVDPAASLGADVRIGPAAVVGAGVSLGDGCEIAAHAVIEGPTKIGPGCRIFSGAVVGMEAQYTGLEGPGGGIEIGAGTVIREGATVHRSFEEGGITRIGENCYLMVQAHVAHDCLLGDRVIMTNSTALSGHVEIADGVFISGFVGIHQFVRIGEGVFLTGPTAVRKDIPPFTNLDGNPPRVRGLNNVGMRRSGISAEVRGHIKAAYRIIFEEEATVDKALARVEADISAGREVKSVIDFLRSSKRGIYRGAI
jgi:UDP-N-acetylglucosamine acyltransferase